MNGNVGNYPPTPRGNTKLQKLKYPLRYSKKGGVAPQLDIFLGAEFLELEVFGYAELEKRERSSLKQPLKSVFNI